MAINLVKQKQNTTQQQNKITVHVKGKHY